MGIHIPAALTGPVGYPKELEDGSTITTVFNLPAFLICAVLALLLVLGVSESAKVNNVIVAIKVTVLVAFIVVGGFIILQNYEAFAPNWDPFIPEPTGEKGEFGWSGILRAASIVFFAYIGFEAVSTAAQEANNPKKDMPFGIIGSLVACTVIYILVSVVLTLIVPYTELNVPDPVAVAVDAFGPQWAWFAKDRQSRAIIGLTSVILVLMYGQTRIFYTMARDGLLPRGVQPRAPEVPDPVDQHAGGGPHRRAGRRHLRHQQPRRHDLGRNAGGLRGGLPVGHVAAPHHPEIPRGYRVPLSGRADPRHCLLPVADHDRSELCAADLRRLHGWR